MELSADGFEKLPLDADHVALVAAPPILPARVILLPAHTPLLGPGFTVAACVTVIVVVLVTGRQGPLPSGSLLVSVSVTLPDVMVGV